MSWEIQNIYKSCLKRYAYIHTAACDSNHSQIIGSHGNSEDFPSYELLDRIWVRCHPKEL